MPIKVLNDDGALGDDVSISLGINTAVDYGAKVINMSLGWSDDQLLSHTATTAEITQAVTESIEYAQNHNTIIVVAAGNENDDTNNHFPARLSTTHDNVITVAALDENDLIASFSNYGDAVDVAAPGVNILSSVPGGECETKSGTSMAAPHVSAAVAMLLQTYPTYTAAQIKEKLKNTTVDLGTPGWDRVFGSGRVDFRMFDGFSSATTPTVAATNMELKQTFSSGVTEQGDVITLAHPLLEENVRLGTIVFPKETTNKSVTYTSNNTNIATYQDGRVVAKNTGNTYITVSKSGISSKTCNITVQDDWINHAALSYARGVGSKTNPYLISTASQLAKLAYETRINNMTYRGKYFKLTNDIDLSGYNWTPIGSVIRNNKIGTETPTFQGHFDGDGHAVRNMTISVSRNRSDETLGLFGYISGYSETERAEIKNLAVINANVSADSKQYQYESGILCGTAYKTDISNCFTQGKSVGAGLVGLLSLTSTIKNCMSIADSFYSGLVVTQFTSSISNSYAAGNATRAGLVYAQGPILNDADLENANASDVSISNSFSVIHAEHRSGAGFTHQKSKAVIDHCAYLSENTVGVRNDQSPESTNLRSMPISFFKSASTYSSSSYWDSSSPWDFTDVWALDSTHNDGLPYLKMFSQYYSITGVSLNTSSENIAKGYSKTLSATVLPTGAVIQSVK